MLTGAKKLSRIICVRVHFKDKVVWIAGNSSGICAEVAKQLAKQGARLVLTARNIELLHSINAECISVGCTSTVLAGNIVKSDGLHELTSKALAIYGVINIVILSAELRKDL